MILITRWEAEEDGALDGRYSNQKLNISHCRNSSRLPNYFVFNKFLHKLCFIEVEENIDKDRGTICSHRFPNDLLKHVSFELNVV